MIMGSGAVITAKRLPQQILYSSTAKQEALLIPEEGISFDEEMARIELAYLQAALRRTGGKKVAAAAPAPNQRTEDEIFVPEVWS